MSKTPGMLPGGFQLHYSAFPSQTNDCELASSFPKPAQELSTEELALVQKVLILFPCNNKNCRYHPGTFEEFTIITQGAAIGWSCCRHLPESKEVSPGVRLAPVLNPAAMKRSCPGCLWKERHLEDVQYSRMTAAFPFDKEAAKGAKLFNPNVSQPGNESQIDSNTPEKMENVEPDQNKGDFIVHNVQEGDTLAGLALKYDVSKEEIRRLNKLPTEELRHLKRLCIPLKGRVVNVSQLPQEETISWKKKSFKQKTGASNEEIDIYLSEHNGNVTEAIKAYMDDLEWEKREKK